MDSETPSLRTKQEPETCHVLMCLTSRIIEKDRDSWGTYVLRTHGWIEGMKVLKYWQKGVSQYIHTMYESRYDIFQHGSIKIRLCLDIPRFLGPCRHSIAWRLAESAALTASGHWAQSPCHCDIAMFPGKVVKWWSWTKQLRKLLKLDQSNFDWNSTVTYFNDSARGVGSTCHLQPPTEPNPTNQPSSRDFNFAVKLASSSSSLPPLRSVKSSWLQHLRSFIRKMPFFQRLDSISEVSWIWKPVYSQPFIAFHPKKHPLHFFQFSSHLWSLWRPLHEAFPQLPFSSSWPVTVISRASLCPPKLLMAYCFKGLKGLS